jgi:preprotein translocase subunit SecY
MISTIAKAFTVPEIRRKIAFTALMLGLYRFGAHLTAPGISASAAKALSKSSAGSAGILSLLNLFSGGALTQMAVFALGIMPYITASIVLQILTVVVPSLEKLSKEGEIGQARITQYTRYLTVGLALGQSIGYVFLFHSLSSQSSRSSISSTSC